MIDVTETIDAYREASRGLWNVFLRPAAMPEVDFDAVERFSCIAQALFDELVLRPIGKEGSRPKPDEPYPFLCMRARSDPTPVMIMRHPPSENAVYWDDPIEQLRRDGLKMQLVECFDFDVLGFREMEFFLVKIVECTEHPHLVGRLALQYARHACVDFDCDAEPVSNDSNPG